ncbi:MAG: hydroxymethylpyrimidine/phosphomethylpyrimidine kinase [Pseudomonadota bacterium]
MAISKSKKNILAIGGHDPIGGAGIQADIEAILAAGCQPLSIITALTAQNTSTVASVTPQNIHDFNEQLTVLMDDITIDACKIGMLACPEQINSIVNLMEVASVPVILDPVLRSGSGVDLIDQNLANAIVDRLLPLTMIATPNNIEAKALSQCQELNDAASHFLSKGCQAVLITGTHEKGDQVINRLYMNDDYIEFEYERLPYEYHGSGCTLAASLAANLIIKEDIKTAVKSALDYTWQSLKYATQQGHYQWHPNRLY